MTDEEQTLTDPEVKKNTSIGVSYDVNQKLIALKFRCKARNVNDVIKMLIDRSEDKLNDTIEKGGDKK